MSWYPMIKPCPFCGGYAVLEQKSKTYIKGELAYVTYCRCTKCHSHGRRVRIYDDAQKSRLIAIQNWNRRVNDDYYVR